MSNKERKPVLFLGHGSPMNAIRENAFSQMLSRLGKTLPRPKAILMVSAHWLTTGTWVTGMPHPKTIHDFYGFPKELFQVQYPAPGAPDLASALEKRFGFKIELENWGLDHGTWSILKYLYPQADAPVVQLSLDRTKSLEEHFHMGENLKALREEGILIIGSGNIVHNLRQIRWEESAKPHEWGIRFDHWVKEKLMAREDKALIEDALKTEQGRLSIPTLEHYLPLLVCLGAAEKNEIPTFVFEGMENGSISMRSISWG